VLLVSIVVSMEINRHYFRNGPRNTRSFTQ